MFTSLIVKYFKMPKYMTYKEEHYGGTAIIIKNLLDTKNSTYKEHVLL